MEIPNGNDNNELFNLAALLNGDHPPFKLENDEFLLRSLRIDDYKLGFLETLKELTEVGNTTKEDFEEQFLKMKSKDLYFIIVIQSLKTGKIVGTGSLLIEEKFIHSNGRAAHIEDIAVKAEMRGKSLGKWLIQALVEVARATKCYKIILDCQEEKVGFYEKCSFSRRGIQMRLAL